MPYQSDHISLSPLKNDWKQSNLSSFFNDLKAGMSVSFLTVPQAMACALIAGLPLSCGLFAAIFPAIIAALFGSSRHLIVGPSTSTAILVQAGTAQILYTHFRELTGVEREMAAFQILTQLLFIIALLQVLAASCKLGRLINFVSHSVTVGYMSGVAASLAVGQLFILFGIPSLVDMDSVYAKGVYFVNHFMQSHWTTACLGLGSLGLMIIIRRIDRRLPAAVITFAIAGLIAHVLAVASADGGAVHVTQELGEGVNKVLVVADAGDYFSEALFFRVPFFNFSMLDDLIPIAFAIALLSILETTSVSKALAANSGQRLSANQEIFGLGLGNLLSSFLGALPVSGSPSRSAMSYESGATTRFAAIFHALFVALILYSLGFLVNRIPLTSLAALLLIAAANIVNKKQFLLCLKATGSDAFVLWVTFLSCVFFRLDVAFYIGIALSITLYLKNSAIPQLIEYSIDESVGVKDIDPTKSKEKRTIRVIKVCGELFFGAADLLQSTLKTMAEDDTAAQVIVLQLKNARDIDATVCLALQRLHVYLKGSGRHLVACGLTLPIWETLSDAGLVQEIGKENLFLVDDQRPYEYMQKALARARVLIAEKEPNQEEVPDLSEEEKSLELVSD